MPHGDGIAASAVTEALHCRVRNICGAIRQELPERHSDTVHRTVTTKSASRLANEHTWESLLPLLDASRLLGASETCPTRLRGYLQMHIQVHTCERKTERAQPIRDPDDKVCQQSTST